MGVPNVVLDDKCTGCGECIESCPTEAITLVSDIAKIDPELCAECQDCVNVCPTEAIVEG